MGLIKINIEYVFLVKLYLLMIVMIDHTMSFARVYIG